MATPVGDQAFQGRTSVTVNWDHASLTGKAVGDRVRLYIGTRSGGTINTAALVSAGWTLVHGQTTAGGMSVACVEKTYAGETGTFNVAVTSGDSTICVMNIRRPDSGKLIVTEAVTTGSDSTSGTGYAATGALAWTSQTGDFIAAFTVVTDDGTAGPSVNDVSQAGATDTGLTATSNFGTTQGADMREALYTVNISSGGTGAPSVTHTFTTSVTGQTLFLLSREVNEGGGEQSGPIPRLTLGSTPRVVARTPGVVSKAVPRLSRTVTPRSVTRSPGSVTRAMSRVAIALTARTVVRAPGTNTRTLPRLSRTITARTLARVPGTSSRPIPRVARPVVARALTKAPGGMSRAVPRLSRTLAPRGVGRIAGTNTKAIPRISRTLSIRAVARTAGTSSRSIPRLTRGVTARSLARTPGASSRLMARITRPIAARAVARAPGITSRSIPRQVRPMVIRSLTRVPGSSSRPVPRLTMTIFARQIQNLAGQLLSDIPRLALSLTGRLLGRTPGTTTKGVQRMTLAISARSVTRVPGGSSRPIPRRQMLITARVLTYPSGPMLRTLPRLSFTSQARPVSRSAGSTSRGISKQQLEILARQLHVTPAAMQLVVDRLLLQIQAQGLMALTGGPHEPVFQDVVLLGFDEQTREVLFDEMEQIIELTVAYSEVSFMEIERYVLMEGTAMELSPIGRELYDPGPSTEPTVAATEWRASFDGGQTWHEPTDVESERPRWLVAGPQADPGAAKAVITGTTRPMLRVEDNPEIIVADGPYIWLV